MKTTRTCCTRHCGNGCALLVTEHDDGSVTVKGHPDHPVTRGFICAKTARFMDRLSDPDRITEPMIRENGVLRSADWEEALGLVAARIDALRHTPERMLHVFYVASYGLLFRASPALFGRLGAGSVSGDYCQDAGFEAQLLDFGDCRAPMLADLLHARSIVNWGRNLDAQAMLAGRTVNEARQGGASVVSVTPGDPGYDRFSDHVVTIRPGTDRFLALAVVKILMERGADLAQARDRGAGWMEFEALAGLHPLETLLEACGVSRADAQLLADHYQRGPTATLIGRGLQRYAQGGENVRFIDALCLCAGTIGVKGGGVHYCQGDLGHIRYDWFKRPAPAPRSFPFHRLGRSIMEADPPVELVYIDGTNVVNQVPDAPALRQALEKPFVVAVEAFMNDTALAADVILPPALLLETEDITRCSSHGYVHHSARALQPRGSCRSNFEIAAGIASRLNPPLPFPTAEEVMEGGMAGSSTGLGLAELRERTWLPSPDWEPPFADGRFAHPDGLARLPQALHHEPAAPEGYPLRLLSLVQKRYLLSQIPEREQIGVQTLWLAPENAQLKENGGPLDAARLCKVVTEFGEMEVEVETLPGLHPEAAYIPRGGWLKTGWGLNALIGPHQADLAGQCAYYAQFCRVENV